MTNCIWSPPTFATSCLATSWALLELTWHPQTSELDLMGGSKEKVVGKWDKQDGAITERTEERVEEEKEGGI